MKKSFSFLLIFFTFFSLLGSTKKEVKTKKYFYYVQFKNKNNSPYSLSNPSDYLSKRAIERRNFFSIPIDSLDLPVNPQYVNSVKNLGATIHCQSKWQNGITILLSDTLISKEVKKLPFVSSVEFTGLQIESKGNYLLPNKVQAIEYGESGSQIKEMNGQALHEKGFLGQGIEIAVIDAGFYEVNTNPAFSYFRNSRHLLGTKDFVNSNADIYQEHEHGSFVLSTMAGKKEDEFESYVGSAIEASYWLIRSEAGTGEYPCEADFWTSAIEYADSVGADIATSSLGYSRFDSTEMNYTHADLDGKTLRASISANIATKKGMLVFVAAGNDGANAWHKIASPADAEGIITVGAVKSDSTMAYFSSFGYSADGRVKPELCARGEGTILLNNAGNVSSGNGTSFATPLLAGLGACYLQAFKEKNISFQLSDLRNNLYRSAHLYSAPTEHTGYGIANFEKALEMLNQTGLKEKKLNERAFHIYKRNHILYVKTNQILTDKNTVTIYDITGKKVAHKPMNKYQQFFDISNLSKGVYLIVLQENSEQKTSKLFINR